MKTVLVLASHPELPESGRAALNPEKYRLVHRIDVSEAEPLLSRGIIDLCLLEVEHTPAQGIWTVEKICRRIPKCPVLVYTGSRDWQWEEEAYLQGVHHVLVKPVRPRLLNVLLDRIWKTPVAAPSDTRPPFAAPVVEGGAAPPRPHTPAQALGILRDFSGILTHSLCAEALLRQFLRMTRDNI